MRSFTSSPQTAAAAFTGPVIELSSSSSSSNNNSPASSSAVPSPASSSTLSSPMSSRGGSLCCEKKKEIILIGGSLGKRTMIKKHLQAYFPGVHEVWVSPHDLYRNATTMSSQAGVVGGSPGKTYAVASNQQAGHGIVDYSGVLDCLEKDLITRSRTSDILGVVPMLDGFVPFADRICATLGLHSCGNNPLTSDHRTDKALMQRCLAAKGLRHCESRSFTSADQALQWKRPSRDSPLVVKPANSGGCDGVCVCVTDEDLRDAFDDNMYRVNAERLTNEKMVMQEYLGALQEQPPVRAGLRRKRSKPGDGCEDQDSSSSGAAAEATESSRPCFEFIVNTVSVDGHHLLSDIWRGTPKAKLGSTECLYDIQESVPWSECPREVVDYAFKVLDATGVRNGAAHTEIMQRGDDVCLIEVNARVAGEVRGDLLRRATPQQQSFDQLYWLLLSLIKPSEFLQATRAYRPECDFNVTALFLRCEEEGPVTMSVRNLYAITQRSQFCRFGRALSPLNQAAPFDDEDDFAKIAERIPRVHNLRKTCDLISSPGVIIMRAEKTSGGRREISKLTARIRKAEKNGTLYVPRDSTESSSEMWHSPSKANLWRRNH